MAKSLLSLFLLVITISFATSARILDDVAPQDPIFADPPATSALPVLNPSTTTTTLPSGQIPVGVAPTPLADDNVIDPPIPEADVPSPDDDVEEPVAVSAPIPLPVATSSTSTGPTSTAATTTSTTPTAVASAAAPSLSFFMHDILGGTQPSVRVVTGIIARTDINGIPFSVPNNNFFPIQGGIPLPNVNNINNLINPNTAPLITGLNPGQANTVLQNSANNNNVVNGNNQPFVTAGQLPPGSIQKVMFGSITVMDDELTEGHELGSAVLGKAQGFYLASSLDGTSHTMAFTMLLHGGDNHIDDTISFFGVHRTASPESQIAIVGGTGKYENAKGYATVETLPQVDQHTTDGVDTVMHFTVYLSE